MIWTEFKYNSNDFKLESLVRPTNRGSKGKYKMWAKKLDEIQLELIWNRYIAFISLLQKNLAINSKTLLWKPTKVEKVMPNILIKQTTKLLSLIYLINNSVAYWN